MKKSIFKAWSWLFNLKNRLIYSVFYYHAHRKNFFPCRLTGEYYIDKLGKTIVEIKDFGNAKHFYAHVKSIFDDNKFLEKFSANDVSRITMAAYNEIFFFIDKNLREEKMNSIIHSSFSEICTTKNESDWLQ